MALAVIDEGTKRMHPSQGALKPCTYALGWQDADSEDKQGRKTEGAYYMWTEQDVDDALGPERARVFKVRTE